MKRLPALTLLAPFTLALLATPASADLLVTEVAGNVRLAGELNRDRAQVATLDQIANGLELVLAPGARAVVVDLVSGSEFELSGEARYQVTAAGPKTAKGVIVTAKPLPDKNLPAVRVSARKASQATFVMRSAIPPGYGPGGRRQGASGSPLDEEYTLRAEHERTAAPVPGMLTLLAPPSGETVLERPLLRWTAHAGATGYRVWVAQAGGTEGWSASTQELEIGLPESHALLPAASYRWRVEALADDTVLSRAYGSFMVAPAEVQALLARLKPEAEAPFARRVLYAAQVEQAGAKAKARALWQALSRERPDDETLRQRAGDSGNGLPRP